MISYITGRGMGHQGRCIAIVKQWLAMGEKVSVYAFEETHSYLQQNLPHFTRLYPYVSDAYKNRQWQRDHAHEFIRNRLVIHDWRPETIRLKRHKKMPSQTLWGAVYHGDWTPSKSREPSRMSAFKKRLRRIANEMDVFFHMQLTPPSDLSPLSACYFPVPLITRPVTQDKETVKATLGLAPDEPFILIHMGAGLGKHRYREIDRWYEAINRFLSGPRMVVAGRLDGVRYRFANHIIQADLFANGKDLVNACDLVISKPGMGILTDCISLRKPLLFFPPDDMERLQKVEMLQQLMGEDALVIGDERDLAAKVRWAMRMKERYRERFSRVPVNGAEVTARICSKIQHMDRATLKRHYKDLRLLTPFGA